MNKRNLLFAWDEIGNALQARRAEDVFRCNAEGGWIFDGWMNPGGPDGEFPYGAPIVEVTATDRHIALSTWAPNKAEAHRRFLHHPVYRKSAD